MSRTDVSVVVFNGLCPVPLQHKNPGLQTKMCRDFDQCTFFVPVMLLVYIYASLTKTFGYNCNFHKCFLALCHYGLGVYNKIPQYCAFGQSKWKLGRFYF